MADSGLDQLRADLVALGRSVVTPEPDERAVSAVLAGLPAQPAPRPRRRRRIALAAVVTALLASLAAPPVRAEVAEWFGFGAVQVRLEPGAPSNDEPAPEPPRAPAGNLEAAAEDVTFSPVVPAALGPPDGVEVSADHNTLSMTWDTDEGVVRVDQIGARLDYVMGKTASDVTYTQVGDAFALWFDRPHEVVVLDEAGDQRREPPRLAGHTLIWERAEVTLRLEGDLSLARARDIAGSMEPLGNR